MAADLAASSHSSLWLEDETLTKNYERLDGDRTVDVAVVGGGITGLTAALLLAREGFEVCLVDQGRIATGTSGYTTAKVTTQHHLTYARLRLTHGKDGAATYASAMEAAKERVAEFVDEGIACDFRRRPSYVYATRPGERRLLEAETRAARDAGLAATLDDDVPLPFPTTGGMRFDNQAEFHPVKYLLGLADRLVETGAHVYEHTRAVHVQEGDGVVLQTERGDIRARHVVVATLMPFLDRGGHFARAYPSRSYVLTARVRGDLPEAMLHAAAPPMYSIRSVPVGGQELLMVLGQSHHVGSSKARPERYEKVAEFARRHWEVDSFEHRWSAQDYTPDDGVPYIGRVTPRSQSVYVATGFKKWGMTGGTLAAMLITDAIAGRQSPWAPLFASNRIKPLAEGPRFLGENTRIGLRFVGDRILARGSRDINDLAPGEGAIVSSQGEKVAGFRSADGGLHAVSTRCTHLGCQVAWNAAESTWDCPCHGSRFAPDGQILNGPATKALEPRPVDPDS